MVTGTPPSMSTQTTLNYRTNRDLFSNYHLDEHLPETEAWDQVDDDELQAAYDEIKQLWEREKDTAPKRNESQLEEKFIRPMFRKLGIPFEVEESAEGTQRRPDYGFFKTEADATDAFQRREEGGDFYKNAIAVADAKRWGRKLDTRGKKKRDYENPSHQIDQYLRFTSTTWGVLTNGQKWRLYYKPTSHKLDSYYEVDLPTVLETGDLDKFKYFYLFFRHEAFVPDASGDAFLDDVYEESNLFAQDLGQDLQDNIYDAIVQLSEGYLQYPENELSEDDLSLIHDSSLIYLYRVIFVLYAEAEGRDLLNTNNEIYESQYSLNQLKQDVADELESGDPKYRDWQSNLHAQLDELFRLIDQGSKSRGIPKEDLYIPAYNGGLFRTNPDEDDSPEAQFLANHTVGDEHLARVIELLTRSKNSNGGGKIFVDYSSLDVRHLGSIYEGLLEYQLNVAEEPLAIDDGEYVVADEGSEIVVERGDVYLTTDSGERKATGSYYTPEYVVEYIVDETLGPLVDDIREDLIGYDSYSEGGFAEEFAERIFELKVLDPAMGSGHFLTSAVDYLARQIIDAQEKQAEQQGVETIDKDRDINWARRKVAQRCIYGVDLNPLATELAKVSLWLRTLAAEQPLAFLDHHLKTGNSLVGSDIEDVLSDGDDTETEDGQLTLQQSFDHTRQRAMEHVTDRFQDLLNIDNETLEDAKEMEAVYEEVRTDPLYQHLIAMANVHTAEQFGLDVPGDAYERMAEALRNNSWEAIEGQDWYKTAQEMAEEQRFFHWELEFPIAFYEQDGVRKEGGGFDAVIGNPPYIRMEKFKSSKDYLSGAYETHASRSDMYIYFVEKSIKILRPNGEYGAIISNKFLRANYGRGLRNFLSDGCSIKEMTDFGELPVFEDASVMPLIILVANRPQTNPPQYADILSLDFDSLSNRVDHRAYECDPDAISGADWRVAPRYVSDLMAKVDQRGRPLGNVVDDQILRGIVTGLNEAFLIDRKDKKELVASDSNSREVIKPLVRGNDMRRYQIENHDQWILYIDHGTDIERYPAVKEYLGQYRSELEDRATEQKWYELQQPQSAYRDFFENPKILYPVIALEPRFAFHEGPLYPNDKCFFIPQQNPELLAVLNSRLTHFYLAQTCSTLGNPSDRGRIEFRGQYLKNLPIAPNLNQRDTDTGERLKELAEKISGLKNQRIALNLTLLDYLGIPSDGLPESKAGETLDEMQMPVAGVADTPLAETTEEYEGLRIEDVSFSEDSRRTVLLADISYKLNEDDPRETDRWGRLAESEFETYEAMAFVGLSDAEETLLREFVPVAVKKAGGFAGFRQSASKTNSPLDRLKDLTLPKIDEVQTGLEQYINVCERADELEEKIENTDQLIDEIVYDLYDLTDEEIEIVESAVADD